MKLILRDNLVLCNQLMLDTDYKMRIALRLNPEDEELKKMVKIRKDLFADSYKEDSFEMGNGDKDGQKNEKYGDKDAKKDVVDIEVDNHENGEENDNDGKNNEDGINDDIAREKGIDEEGLKDVLNDSSNKGREGECMKVVGDKSSNEADYHTEYQEPRNVFSSNNKRRKLNPEEDVSVSQLNWGIGDESRMIETNLNTDM